VASLAVKSAARAIEVLECFSASREPKSLKSICELLQYPQSSTSVLLKTLTVMGYLNYDRRQRVYFPTLKVTALGDWVPQALFGNGRAREAMRDVHSATGETVSIAVKNDIYFQYIKVIQSMHALRFHVTEGTMRLLTQSAVGWLLMSTLKGDDLDTVIRRANVAAGRAEAVNVAAMVATVTQARRQGYAAAENVPFLGGATLCVLLPITIQGQPVALGLGGSLERIRANRSRYLAALRRCAKELRAEAENEIAIDIEF
jgi:DNA-binding IclR family transcriptional regulator